MRQRRRPPGAASPRLPRLHTVARSRTERADRDQGFTLIELIVVIAILPLVIGAISVALISVISQQSTAAHKVSDSADTTVLSAVFTKDVQSAQYVTTKTSVAAPSPCDTSSPVVSFQWPSTGGTVVVSYAVAQRSGSNNDSLFRHSCQGDTVDSRVVAYNVQSSLTAEVSGNSCTPYSCSAAKTAAAAGWTPAAGMKSISLTVAAPEKTNSGTATYSYTLVGVPRTSNNISRGSPVSPGHPPLLMLGGSSPGVSCVGHDSLTVNGTAAINSTANPAVQTTGNGAFTATSLYTDGPTTAGAWKGNNVDITSGSVTSGVNSADPYADANGNSLLTPPISEPLPNGVGNSYDGLPVYNSGNYSGPGIYTSTLKITSSQALASGVYVFQNGLSVSGNGAVTTDSGGVFFYVDGGSLSITGNGSVTLDPMSSPPSPAPNLVIWQVASDTAAMSLHGNGGAIAIGGTIYAPKVALGVGGNGNLKVGSVVADSVSCNGGGNSGSIVVGST